MKRIGRFLKGVLTGAFNTVTGGLLSNIKEATGVIKARELVKMVGNEPGISDKITKFTHYNFFDLMDDGKLNDSFDREKAQIIGKIIGSVSTLIFGILYLIKNS